MAAVGVPVFVGLGVFVGVKVMVGVGIRVSLGVGVTLTLGVGDGSATWKDDVTEKGPRSPLVITLTLHWCVSELSGGSVT